MAKTSKKSGPPAKDKETNYRSAKHVANDKESITNIKSAKKQNEVIENQAGKTSPPVKKN